MAEPEQLQQPWERRPDETMKWYARFWEFVQLPPASRSVSAVFRQMTAHKAARSPTPDWLRMSQRHEWVARALAYDVWQREQLHQVEMQEALEWRRARRGLLHDFTRKVTEVVSSLTTEQTFTLNEVVAAVRAVTEQLRTEYGDIAPLQTNVAVAVSSGGAATAGGGFVAEVLDALANAGVLPHVDLGGTTTGTDTTAN